MSAVVAIVAVPLLAWWVVAPLVSLLIGLKRGRPFLGWLCGLLPIFGPFLAAKLPPQR